MPKITNPNPSIIQGIAAKRFCDIGPSRTQDYADVGVEISSKEFLNYDEGKMLFESQFPNGTMTTMPRARRKKKRRRRKKRVKRRRKKKRKRKKMTRARRKTKTQTRRKKEGLKIGFIAYVNVMFMLHTQHHCG